MMKTIMIKRTDGGISIMGLIPQAIIDAEGIEQPITMYRNDLVFPEGARFVYADVATEVAKWTLDQRDIVVSWRECAANGVPVDRTFRNAWADVSPAPVVDIDMPKAREIHKNNLRAMRAPRLKALDTEFMLAIEVKDETRMQQVVAQKQLLRDVTDDPRIAGAMTTAELREAVPDILKAP